jgi:hypothetical protein
VSGRDELAQRLEMLLVLQWLDEGAVADGTIGFSPATAASELDLEPGRTGLLALMRALSDLEERGLVEVRWPPGGWGRAARVTLGQGLRDDARRQFGR